MGRGEALEKADFEKTLRTRLELYKEHKPNGLLLKFSSVVCSNFVKNVPTVRYYSA
jgi:Na+/H+ antiporter NhaD/arsenite permease-like protein